MSDASADLTEIDRIIDGHRTLEGPMLPILHAIQHAFGHIPEAAIARIAHALNLGRAEVHGVVSFYHDFRETPAGTHTLRICRAEACQAQGGAALEAAAQRRLATGWHGTGTCGVTLEPVYCLGLCACGPAVELDGQLHGRVDADRLETLLKEAGA
ncbi:hypothetical protein ATO6_21190 [Oceanicola sp. 22II-s10i]|uniref:formate dehydrogenase subunit gamma n=1 Tax=Oceanicola sp. 22II-s10i TaxID=1317116 RepID=UPI000B51E8D3|nr:formate dehydrogenase subunit gamma [Oceanicola sp. 22II-s10i]OWU82969.1 hypothetical protein ATO6_21190 [Oceanicola sp. 22II-s10i]